MEKQVDKKTEDIYDADIKIHDNNSDEFIINPEENLWEPFEIYKARVAFENRYFINFFSKFVSQPYI